MKTQFKIERYRSGYTEIDWVLGMVPRNEFADTETYLVREAKNTVVVYSILRQVQASASDIVKALRLVGDGTAIYVESPFVELSGNAYRFYSRRRPTIPFLTVTTTNVVADYFPSFDIAGRQYNAFFNGPSRLPVLTDAPERKAYNDFAALFYRRVVLDEEDCYYANVIDNGNIATQQA